MATNIQWICLSARYGCIRTSLKAHDFLYKVVTSGVLTVLPISHPENITKWLSWGYWTSPLMYVQNALSVNEFLGEKWKARIPVKES